MARRTIKLKNYANVMEWYDANAAITPGMLIELMSTEKVRAHASAGQNALPMFAVEDELQGKSITDAYAASDKVSCWIPNRGDMVNAILADGENAAIGSFLESNGDGMLKVHVADVESFESNEAGAITVYPNQIIGVAVEAVDLSDSSGGESSGELSYDKRIKVRII
jgi:hypothetical protein